MEDLPLRAMSEGHCLSPSLNTDEGSASQDSNTFYEDSDCLNGFGIADFPTIKTEEDSFLDEYNLTESEANENSDDIYFKYKREEAIKSRNEVDVEICRRRFSNLNPKMLLCKECDYSTMSKANFQRHCFLLHIKIKYKCEECDFKCNHKKVLTKHVDDNHLTEHRYECLSCYYSTNNPYNLKQHHEGVHSKEKKFLCSECDYATNVKSALRRHFKGIHLKLRKFTCEACDYRTTRKEHLDNHHRKAHA